MTLQAVGHCMGSLTSTLVASAEIPKVAAVSAAPTVPEWRHAWPRFGPALTPVTTRSGGSPNAPKHAAITARPGGPAIEYADSWGAPGIEAGVGSLRWYPRGPPPPPPPPPLS